jgi:hypothetical protein
LVIDDWGFWDWLRTRSVLATLGGTAQMPKVSRRVIRDVPFAIVRMVLFISLKNYLIFRKIRSVRIDSSLGDKDQ